MNSSSSEMKLRSPVRSQGRSGETEQDALQRLGVVKNDVTSAISNSPGLDVLLHPPLPPRSKQSGGRALDRDQSGPPGSDSTTGCASCGGDSGDSASGS